MGTGDGLEVFLKEGNVESKIVIEEQPVNQNRS